MKSWVSVSRERLAENFRATLDLARHQAEEVDLLAVVKADAYSHGAAVCAPVLAAAGARWLGVTDAAEGAAVRRVLQAAGLARAVQPRILIMCGHLPEDIPLLIEHGLTPVVWTPAQVTSLAGAAGDALIAVHLEVDTGMSRQGVPVGEPLRALLRRIAAEPKLVLDGVMTHFASADVVGSSQTEAQRRQFVAAVGMVRESGLRPAWLHAGNTSGLDDGSARLAVWLAEQAGKVGARAMLREGLGLYGYCLPLTSPKAAELGDRLRPVMTWKTRLLAVSDVEAGARIGYDGAFTAPRSMRLGLLPIGYADGLRRELSSSNTGSEPRSGGWVRIAAHRAAILGRISMNLTTVDLSDVPEPETGDEVVLLGEGITAGDHAALAGTIPYEILCGIRAPIVPE